MLDNGKIESFTVKNADYYLEQWRRFGDASGSVASFNKAAFFTAGLWLIYRKLYVPALWLLAVLVADITLTIYLEDSRIVPAGVIAAWDRFSPFIYGGVIGAFGNYWYWRKFRRIENQSISESPDPAIQNEFLRSKGGTNPIGVWIVVIASVALIALAFLPVA